MNEEVPNKFIPREFKGRAYPWRKSKFTPIAKENLPNKTIEGKVLRVVGTPCDCSVIRK